MTCEVCGHRNALVRRVTQPERIDLVCHECEGLIHADMTPEIMALTHA